MVLWDAHANVILLLRRHTLEMIILQRRVFFKNLLNIVKRNINVTRMNRKQKLQRKKSLFIFCRRVVKRMDCGTGQMG